MNNTITEIKNTLEGNNSRITNVKNGYVNWNCGAAELFDVF